MGKHKEKKSKHKKHKKEKKHKKRKHSTSSSSSDEWIEKETNTNETTTQNKSNSEQTETKRDDWMNVSTSFTMYSNENRKKEREDNKKIEREKQVYNPSEYSRELNPYWKNGGSGLPMFKKPSEDDLDGYSTSSTSKSLVPKWKKSKTIDESNKIPVSSNEEKIIDTTKSNQEKSVLSKNDLNVLAAELVKAEIMGNTILTNQLKVKLDAARNSLYASSEKEENILLTQTDSRGYSRPVKTHSNYGESSGSKKKKGRSAVETHEKGERVRYFADDETYSLKEMFEKEKYNTIDDENEKFVRIAGKVKKNDDMDDLFADDIRKMTSEDRIDSKNRDKAINEHERLSKSIENCARCLQSEVMDKNLMISLGETMYLSLPSHEPLTTGHCFIVPTRHISCATQLDENEWSELLDFRKALTKMFSAKDEDVIFYESAIWLHKFPHMYLECVPVPKEQGDLAPIYFKKAIDESEVEWSQNKKLVTLRGRDVRKAIPKGLPYFFVSFGMEEGFAHVVEDNKMFPGNFAQEIIGGMLDLHHSKWRKPRRQNLTDQNERVKEFSKNWSSFDCTQDEGKI